MNRLAITQLSAVALTAGLLFACKMQTGPSTPSRTDAFLAEIIATLGVDGQACFERDGQEQCVTKAAQPIGAGDHVAPASALMLCTRSDGALSDCKDLRHDASLEIDYVCSNGMCYCTGVASCTLMALDCGPSGGRCGECAVGDCCCLDPDIDMPL